jgi:hypothetical protein
MHIPVANQDIYLEAEAPPEQRSPGGKPEQYQP